MENKIISEKDSRREALARIFMGLICVLGFVTGTVVFCRTFDNSDIEAYINSNCIISEEFSNALLKRSVREGIHLGFTVLLSTFALGWIMIPGLLFYRGLGIGIAACCIFDKYGMTGALLILGYIFAPSAIALVAHVFASCDAFSVSYGIFSFLIGRNDRKNSIVRLLTRLPLCSAGLVCAAAIAALFGNYKHLINV